ncbi:serine protease 30-like [Daphnia carinata]|uniref:serine protease 30-like n=1 Tax=Daphnia carinata TaxID=120202 RepID=UPI002868684F|nr:serine protease 30-like [Daphnia carinata]
MQIMRLSSFFTLLSVLQLHVIHGFTNLADVDCGLSSIKGRKAKIVNGDETFEGEFPWMVSLVGLRGELICGGVLIHNKWVLTAAHCIRQDHLLFPFDLN